MTSIGANIIYCVFKPSSANFGVPAVVSQRCKIECTFSVISKDKENLCECVANNSFDHFYIQILYCYTFVYCLY